MHTSALNRDKHQCARLQHAWNEDGPSAFIVVIVEQIDDLSLRRKQELKTIMKTNVPYNTVIGTLTGPNPGYTHTPEARRRMSLALRGKPKSAEHKAKLSAWRTGRKFPAHSAALMGRKLSDETRAKMSEAHKNRPPKTAETCAKLSAALTGRLFSLEWKAKISASKRGRPWSDARRAALVARKTSVS